MTSRTEPKEKYLPDERDNSPVDNWLDAMIDGKLESAVYKAVNGPESLDIDINSNKFRDECFKEAPWAESFYDIELGYVPEHGDQQHFYDIVEAMDDFTNS
jgi:hypothetical protein